MRQYAKSDFKVMPWKNGQGITTELFRIEDDHQPDGFLLRLSRAMVNSSGNFSMFPGIDRQILLLNGNGFNLTSPAFQKTIKKPFELFSFRGEDSIQCELLEGPCEDFNIMVKRDWREIKTILLNHKHDVEFTADYPTLIYDVSREVLWHLNQSETLLLTSGSFIIIQLIGSDKHVARA